MSDVSRCRVVSEARRKEAHQASPTLPFTWIGRDDVQRPLPASVAVRHQHPFNITSMSFNTQCHHIYSTHATHRVGYMCRPHCLPFPSATGGTTFLWTQMIFTNINADDVAHSQPYRRHREHLSAAWRADSPGQISRFSRPSRALPLALPSRVSIPINRVNPSDTSCRSSRIPVPALRSLTSVASMITSGNLAGLLGINDAFLSRTLSILPGLSNSGSSCDGHDLVRRKSDI
jgi:hypothetical protein